MLSGKVALVTGGARGIGREIALTFGKNGATVIVNYNGSKEKAEELVSLIEEQGGKATAIQCDVSDNEACKGMIDQVLKEYGRVDILVNNAGVTRDNLIMRMSEEDYDLVLNTNLKGAFHTIRHLSRSFLKQRSGKIINISSITGIMGNPGQANYAASKAGLIGLTKSVAKELGSRGICVNAIAPGFIETDMTNALGEEVRAAYEKQIPLGRLGKPQDIAELALFLAGSGSDYITGQVISVNGGMA